MREFKKYFFESLIQLTILASVFRQNSDVSLNHTTNRFIDELNNNNNFLPTSYSDLTRNNSLAGELDLLLLNENSNYFRYHTNLNNSNYSSPSGSDLIHRNHLIKEQENLNDLKLIQRFNRLLSSSSSSTRYIKPIDPITNQQLFPNNLFVAPATFQNNNHKELQLDLTEAQNPILVDLNANSLSSFSKEEIFEMEVDFQKIIERDIDIGITKEFYLDFDPSNSDSYFDPNDGITWKKGGQDLTKTLLEKQKDTDLLSLTSIFEQQYVPEGYQLVVEEDTGEWILTVLPTDNSTNNEPTEPPQTQQLNRTLSHPIFNTSSSPKPLRKLVNHSKSIEPEDVETEGDNSLFNIKVKFSIFDDKERVHKLIAKEVEESRARHAIREAQRNATSSGLVNFNPVVVQESTQAATVSTENVIQPLRLNPDLLRQTSVDTELLKMFDDASILNDYQFNTTQLNMSSINQNDLAYSQPKQDEHIGLNLNTSFIPSEPVFANEYSSTPVINVNAQQMNNSFMGYQTTFEEGNLNGLKANVSMQPSNMTINYDFLASFESNMENIPSPLADQSSSDQSDASIDFNLEALDAYFEQAVMMNNPKQGNFTSLDNRQLSSELANSHDGFDINEIFKMMEETNLNISSELNPKSRVENNSAPSLSSSLLTTSLHGDSDSAKTHETIRLKEEATEVEDDAKPFDIVYNRSAVLRGLEHNHTYLYGSQSQDENNTENFRILHPYSYKNKLKKMKNNRSESNLTMQQETRDHLLLRENNIEISLDQIVNTDADQFNELLKAHALNNEQMNIVKDIRRRGKNKVAAQICRKRKIDSIDALKEDVGELREERKLLQNEYQAIEAQIKKMTLKFDELYKDLMGNEYDKNDPIMICMTNLKDQLNLSNKPTASTLNDSVNEDEEDLDDFDDDEDEEEDEDDFEDDEDYDGLEYANTQVLVNAKKPLAKSYSNNRRSVSSLNPSMLSPPTTEASNSSMSDEPSTSQVSKAKRFKRN